MPRWGPAPPTTRAYVCIGICPVGPSDGSSARVGTCATRQHSVETAPRGRFEPNPGVSPGMQISGDERDRRAAYSGALHARSVGLGCVMYHGEPAVLC